MEPVAPANTAKKMTPRIAVLGGCKRLRSDVHTLISDPDNPVSREKLTKLMEHVALVEEELGKPERDEHYLKAGLLPEEYGRVVDMAHAKELTVKYRVTLGVSPHNKHVPALLYPADSRMDHDSSPASIFQALFGAEGAKCTISANMKMKLPKRVLEFCILGPPKGLDVAAHLDAAADGPDGEVEVEIIKAKDVRIPILIGDKQFAIHRGVLTRMAIDRAPFVDAINALPPPKRSTAGQPADQPADQGDKDTE